VQKPSFVSADSLYIRFYGPEHSYVEYSETEGSGDDQRTVTKRAYATKLFYDVDYPL
jgi:heptaprenylglyceryl phosphate synthase